MNTAFTTNSDLHDLIPLLCSLSRVHTVYLMRQVSTNRTQTYTGGLSIPIKPDTREVLTLLVISHEQVADPMHIQHSLLNKTQGRYEVFSIHLTLREANSRINWGSTFLNRVLRECKLLYREDQQLELPVSDLQHPQVYARIATHWNTRLQRAHYFETKAVDCEDPQSNYGKYLLLQQAVQQACLGLIYVFWEYQPSCFALPYLLHLCEHFCDLPQILYPKRSFRSHQVYTQLCHASYNLHEKTGRDTSDADAHKAEQLTYRFIKAARQLAEEKLRELKQRHHTPFQTSTYENETHTNTAE